MNILRERNNSSRPSQEIDPRAMELAAKWAAEDRESEAGASDTLPYVSVQAAKIIDSSFNVPSIDIPNVHEDTIADSHSENSSWKEKIRGLRRKKLFGRQAITAVATATAAVLSSGTIHAEAPQAIGTSQQPNEYSYAAGAGAGLRQWPLRRRPAGPHDVLHHRPGSGCHRLWRRLREPGAGDEGGFSFFLRQQAGQQSIRRRGRRNPGRALVVRRR